VSKKLVPSSGTYLCSMQGNTCGTWTLGGMFPLWVKGVKLQRIYERHCLANDENCWGKRLITRKWEPDIRLNNASRIMGCNYNLTQQVSFFVDVSPLGPKKYKIIPRRTLLANGD
jgi:hypothetical protein